MRARSWLALGLVLAAWRHAVRPRAARIERISRVVADLGRAEAFYCGGLGFRRVGGGPGDPAVAALLGLGRIASQTVLLELGGQHVELVRFASEGRPYPPDSRSDDLWFQHLAIVVSDMDAAFAHLSAQPEMRPITQGGPQLLPPSSGGVRAFKFRDPEGHPLELLWFPPGRARPPGAGLFLGIDHSALAVSDTARSLGFYRRLGLRIAERSLNHGPEQSRLDAVPQACVHVTGLRLPRAGGPGLELLGYVPPGRSAPVAADDMACDWVVLASVRPLVPAKVLRDPDGHRLLLTAAPIPPAGR